jgi:predicted transcriptional regulator
MTLTIPADVQAKFAALIELIKSSESMNDEERQYWINILPIMTPDQIQNLQLILENEKRQLAAIDAKYAKEIERIGQTESIAQTDEERKQKRESRRANEEAHRTEEEQQADELLKQIENP